MSSNTTRGNQVGQYQLGARYKNTGSLGRVYRAHNVETGAPALVLQRTERQAEDMPLADWQVRVTSSVSPAFLAFEVESAPAGGDPMDVAGELVFMLEDAAQVVDTTINRPETMPHLRAVRVSPAASPRAVPQPTPTPSHPSIWRRPAFAAALSTLAAAALLHLAPVAPVLPSQLDSGAGLASLDDAGMGGAGDIADDLVLTGMVDDEPFVLARALPKRPFSNQKRPPCDKQLEAELHGGCWVPHETRPPCPDRLYELEGKCYLPAAKQESAPTTFSRQPLAFDRP